MSYPSMKLGSRVQKTEIEEDSTMREQDDRYIEKLLQSHYRSRPLSAKIVEKKTGVNFRPKAYRPTSAKKTGMSPIKRPETYLNSRIRPNQTIIDKERLYDDNMSLKMQINAYKVELTNAKTRLKQLEKENKRQNEEIEEIGLYDKTPAHKYIRLTNALRKSVKDLRIECKQKDDEINKLKKHIKFTKVTEYEAEISIFQNECFRLKHILEESLKRKPQDTPLNLPEVKPREASSSKKDTLEKKDQKSLILSLQEENQRLREKLESNKSKSKNVSKDSEKSLKHEIQKLKLQLEASHKEFSDKEANLKSEILRLKKLEEESRQASDQHQLAIKSLQNQLKSLKSPNKELIPEPPSSAPLEKSNESNSISRSPAKLLQPLIQHSQISHFFKHIYLSMQLHRLQIEKLPDVLLSKISEPDVKLPAASLKKMFPNPPFAFIDKQNLTVFFQFLAQPEDVEFLETWQINALAIKPNEVVEKVLEKIPKWKIFGNEEENEFDNELAQLIRMNKDELFRNCLKYDDDGTGVVEMKDFKLALKDAKIIFQPRLFEYVTLLFYSHEYEIEKVPYRNFLKAYGETSEHEDFIDEEKLQTIKSCLLQIAQALNSQKLSVREVFQPVDSLIYPESFVSGLETLGLKSIDQDTIILVLDQLQYENESETCISLAELEKIMDTLGVGSYIKQEKKSHKSFSSKGSSDKSSNLIKKSVNDTENYEYSIDSPDKYGISEISPFGSVSNTDLHGKYSPTVNDFSKIDLEQINDEGSEYKEDDAQEIRFSPESVKKKENVSVKKMGKKKSKEADSDQSSGEGKTLEYSLTVAPVDKSGEQGNRVNKTEDFDIPGESLKFFESARSHQSLDLHQDHSQKSGMGIKMTAKELEDKEKYSEDYSSFNEYGSSDEEKSYKGEPVNEKQDLKKSENIDRTLISSPIDTYGEYSQREEEKKIKKKLEVYSEKEVIGIFGKKTQKTEENVENREKVGEEYSISSSKSSKNKKKHKKSSSSSSDSSKHKKKHKKSSSSSSKSSKNEHKRVEKDEKPNFSQPNEGLILGNELKYSETGATVNKNNVESYGNATFGEQFMEESISEDQNSDVIQNPTFEIKNLIEISQATFSFPTRLSQEISENIEETKESPKVTQGLKHQKASSSSGNEKSESSSAKGSKNSLKSGMGNSSEGSNRLKVEKKSEVLTKSPEFKRNGDTEQGSETKFEYKERLFANDMENPEVIDSDLKEFKAKNCSSSESEESSSEFLEISPNVQNKVEVKENILSEVGPSIPEHRELGKSDKENSEVNEKSSSDSDESSSEFLEISEKLQNKSEVEENNSNKLEENKSSDSDESSSEFVQVNENLQNKVELKENNLEKSEESSSEHKEIETNTKEKNEFEPYGSSESEESSSEFLEVKENTENKFEFQENNLKKLEENRPEFLAADKSAKNEIDFQGINKSESKDSNESESEESSSEFLEYGEFNQENNEVEKNHLENFRFENQKNMIGTGNGEPKVLVQQGPKLPNVSSFKAKSKESSSEKSDSSDSSSRKSNKKSKSESGSSKSSSKKQKLESENQIFNDPELDHSQNDDKNSFFMEKSEKIPADNFIFPGKQIEETKNLELTEPEAYQLNKFPALSENEKNKSSSESLKSSNKEDFKQSFKLKSESSKSSSESNQNKPESISKSSKNHQSDKSASSKKENFEEFKEENLKNFEDRKISEDFNANKSILNEKISKSSSSSSQHPVHLVPNTLDHSSFIPVLENKTEEKFEKCSNDAKNDYSSQSSVHSKTEVTESKQRLVLGSLNIESGEGGVEDKYEKSQGSEKQLQVYEPELNIRKQSDASLNSSEVLSKDVNQSKNLSSSLSSSSSSSSSHSHNKSDSSSSHEIQRIQKNHKSSSSSSNNDLSHQKLENPSDRFESRLISSSSSSINSSHHSPNRSSSSSNEKIEVYSSIDSQSL